MTRDQRINRRAADYAKRRTAEKDLQSAYAETFRAGAKWADVTLIGKANRWLYEHIGDYKKTVADGKQCIEITIIDDLMKYLNQ